MADKYGIDVASIKTAGDMAAVLKKIKRDDPTVTPLELTAALTTAAGYFPQSQFDNLGDNIGVLMLNNKKRLKVVDLYETPQYAAILKTVRAWWQAGYVNRDAPSAMLMGPQAIGAGKAFAAIPPGVQPVTAYSDSAAGGVPVEEAMISRPYASTSTCADMMLAIPASSKDPARAMRFINLLYTDPQVVNLLDWGIEGKDYVKKPATTVDYPPGVTANTDGYDFFMGDQMGDQFLSYTSAAEPADLWQQMKAWDKNAVKSPALGFLFNPNPVKMQYAAVSNVIAQYAPQLQTGSVDPAKVLPEFIAKLKAAGIDQVIAEKQKQLDAWAKKQP